MELTNNFEFLKGSFIDKEFGNSENENSYFPVIDSIKEIEEAYIENKFNDVAQKGRICIEQLVKIVFRKFLNQPDFEITTVKSLYNRVNNDPNFTKFVDSSLLSSLSRSVFKGNEYSHNNTGKHLKKEVAIKILITIFNFCRFCISKAGNTTLTVTFDANVYNAFKVEKTIIKFDNNQSENQGIQGNQVNQDLSNLNTKLTQSNIIQNKNDSEAITSQKSINEEKACEKFLKYENLRALAIYSNDLEAKAELDKLTLEKYLEDEELTPSQKNLVINLDSFFKSNDTNIFILKGYAGTGKTFMVKAIAEFLYYKNWNISLTAPTGKAAKVLADATDFVANTVHSHIYDYHFYEDRQNYQMFTRLVEKNFEGNSVLVVDEASLIGSSPSLNDDDEDELKFGSGSLLSDIIEYQLVDRVNLDNKNHNSPFKSKLIFIGDDKQLPPVREEISNALNKEVLENFKVYYLNDPSIDINDIKGDIKSIEKETQNSQNNSQKVWSYCKEDSKNFECKLIFGNSIEMLPPISKETFNTLNLANKVFNTLSFKVQTCKLTDIVRQKENSLIIKNASLIKYNIENHVYNYLDLLTDNKDNTKKIKEFVKIDEKNIVYLYQKLKSNSKNDVQLIAHSNKEVKDYNNKIQQVYFPNDNDLIHVNERLLVTKNLVCKLGESTVHFFNGEFLNVESLSNNIETKSTTIFMSVVDENNESKKKEYPIKLHFIDATIKKLDTDDENSEIYNTKLLVNFIDGEFENDEFNNLNTDKQRKYLNQALLNLCRKEYDMKGRPGKFKEYKTRDSYYNSLHVNLGYAITCHKSQGSSWENVIVKCRDLKNIDDEKLRWLYTAITRASRTVYISNFEEQKCWQKK